MTEAQDTAGRADTSRLVLSVRGLTIRVSTPEGAKAVVEDMSFDLRRGETLCLAGERGSGKSMTALAIMGLLPKPMAPIAAGTITLADGPELAGLSEARFRSIRANRIAMIFQEPVTSLNPVMTIGRQLAELLLEHRVCARAEVPARALALFEDAPG